MLCQNCQKRDAVIHVRRILNGEAGEMHLCAECARNLGYSEIFSGFSLPFAGGENQREISSISSRVLRCETCGFSFDDIARSSSPGCPDCYLTFGDKLRPYLRKIHGRTAYQGVPFPRTPAPESPAGNKWYEEKEQHSDIVLGSVVRAAANVKGVPFPVRLNIREKNLLHQKLCLALRQSPAQLSLISMGNLYPYEAVSLAERFVVTPAFASAGAGALLLTGENGNLSIMLGEEDHLKIQYISGGLSPEKAYGRVAYYKNLINKELELAVDKTLGFLNQSPMNIGTGLQVSAIMHLPALSRSGALPALASTFHKMGLALKGAYGDGLTVKGDLYRLSNTLTMGISEEEAIQNLKSICLQLATRERLAAETLLGDIGVRDRIQRSVALLSSAVLLTSNELIDLLSWVRLGSLYGVCGFEIPVINDLMIRLFPASVNAAAGQRLSAERRDELRAKIVRAALFGEKSE